MSVYSGPSEYALEKRQSEQQADYDQAREAFEFLLEFSTQHSSLADWFGDGGVTDYAPIFVALVAARDAGVEEARALLADWADSYAKDRT